MSLLEANEISLCLIAQSRIDELGHHFQQNGPSNSSATATAYAAMLLVPVLAAISGYVIYLYANRPHLTHYTQVGLLAELCRLHGIRTHHQMLLQTIAEVAELPNAAILFAIPDAFESAVEQAEIRLPLTNRDRRAIGQLRRQMFSNQ